MFSRAPLWLSTVSIPGREGKGGEEKGEGMRKGGEWRVGCWRQMPGLFTPQDLCAPTENLQNRHNGKFGILRYSSQTFL